MAHKLAIIDLQEVLPEGSARQREIEEQLQLLEPRVLESIEQVGDMTVTAVNALRDRGVRSSNLEILTSANAWLTPDTKGQWPVEYAQVAALVATMAVR